MSGTWPRCFQYSLRIVGFCDNHMIPSPFRRNRLSVFPANRGVLRLESHLSILRHVYAFSIPCESWGSATGVDVGTAVGVFVFQYSLRIVGFCDYDDPHAFTPADMAFSIPCESWGSATCATNLYHKPDTSFQYSLRIVGFCDK